jgi:hypothetical protein
LEQIMQAACRKGDMGRGRWADLGGRSGQGPSPSEKATIVAACERFITEVLRPRFLPEIRPTEFNYPIDIRGKWHGRNYRFFQRYRSDGHHTEKGEFDWPFVRLEYVGPDRFDISFFRHTEKWWPLHRSVTLKEALRLIETDGLLHPL